MKRLLMVATVASALFGCQTTGTGEPGVRFGMTKQKVIERVSRADKVISTDGDTVISEGIFEPTNQRARKTFRFQDGKLVDVSHTIL